MDSKLADSDLQVGLNGVDNGSLRFTGVRIPRGNLLDRFGQVDNNGQYSSPFSMNRRFAATLGELTGGRVGLTCASVGVLKVAVKTIALSVACSYICTCLVGSRSLMLCSLCRDHFICLICWMLSGEKPLGFS